MLNNAYTGSTGGFRDGDCHELAICLGRLQPVQPYLLDCIGAEVDDNALG